MSILLDQYMQWTALYSGFYKNLFRLVNSTNILYYKYTLIQQPPATNILHLVTKYSLCVQSFELLRIWVTARGLMGIHCNILAKKTNYQLRNRAFLVKHCILHTCTHAHIIDTDINSTIVSDFHLLVITYVWNTNFTV